MKFIVLSDAESSNYIPKDKTAIIRIYQGNKKELSKLKGKFDAELVLKYHDIYFKDMYSKDKIQLLKEDNIYPYDLKTNKKLWKFLDEVKDFDTLIIHCAMGSSRSPSVAIGVSWYYDMPILEKKLCAMFDLPNNYLLNFLASDLNIKRDYLKYDTENEYKEYMKALKDFSGDFYKEKQESDELKF